jgi:hypothetical protein
MKRGLLALAKAESAIRRKYTEALAGQILVAWATRDEITQQRLISNDEMRDTLLHANDNFRSRVLWLMERWSESNEPHAMEKWSQLVTELVQEIWPRQKSVKTPTISARLCGLALATIERWPEIKDIVLPLLTTIDKGHWILPNLRKEDWKIINLYPKQVLALLYAVLSENAEDWPYEIGEVLERLNDPQIGLIQDGRLLELNRKWNGR